MKSSQKSLLSMTQSIYSKSSKDRTTKSLLNSTFTLLAAVFVFQSQGCTNPFMLEYGRVQGRFQSTIIAEEGKTYLNKKVTVQGTVTDRIYDAQKGRITMVLDNEVFCIWYGDNREKEDILMTTTEYSVGKIVALTGYLIRCDENKVILNPVHETEFSE